MSDFYEKAEFVGHELKAVVQAIDKDVVDLEYERLFCGEEYITIVYRTSAGVFKKKVNVTADSLRAIAYDVIRRV